MTLLQVSPDDTKIDWGKFYENMESLAREEIRLVIELNDLRENEIREQHVIEMICAIQHMFRSYEYMAGTPSGDELLGRRDKVIREISLLFATAMRNEVY